MKKYSSILLALTTLAFAASCAKEVRVDNPKEETGDMINITIVASDKPEPVTAAGTKTFVDGSAIKWADSGEKIEVFELATPTSGDAVVSKKESAEGGTTDSGATMTFGVSMPSKSEGYTAFDYYAIYPSSAYYSNTGVTSVAINTAAAQSPSSSSFDSASDLLIAQKIENGASQASSLDMKFSRMVAIGKMTIKNLESSEDITKITFTAKIGGEDVILAGRTAFNLETGLPVSEYGSNTADHSIILNYAGKGIKANSSMVAYFTCYPFALNSETPGSFKVVIETATQSFTKEVNVSSAKGLVFRTGKASVFSVDMDGIAGEDKAQALCYAYLNPSDVSLGNSYGNASVTKTHGDTWSMFACNASGNIGVRRNDNGENDSFIKLPDFVDNIKTVVVTLNSPTSGKTITLESTATDNSASIAELTTTSATVYTFDLTSGPYVKTAYFRCSGAQAKVEKIEVYAGTDTRTKLSNPTNVNAVLNTDDPSVTNTIDVTWDAVTNAGSYIVTLVPYSGDDVVTVANTNSCSVTGLQYDMEYLAAVEAVPADPYLYKNSDAVDASDVAETGSDPAAGGPYYEKVTSLSNVTAGEYIIVNNGTYLPNASTSSAPAAIAVTISADKVQSVTDAMKWTFTGTTSGMTIRSIVSGTPYLYAINNNNGIRVGNTNDTWEIAENGAGFSLKSNNQNRYCATTTNNGGDWRSYNSATSTYYLDGGRVYLYKLVDNRPEPGMEWSAASATATYSGTSNTPSFSAPTLDPGDATGITYSSSDETIATINESTGAISINLTGGHVVKEGSTTISAIFAGDATYKAQTVSYTLTVADSRTQVATPTFSPAAGEVAADTPVSFACATSDVTYYYTTNNTDPTLSSSTGSSVTIDANKTVKVFAVKSGYKPSEIATAVYTIAGGGGGGTASFAPSNFSGQGTTGTGSSISATVDGVTFACDKGYGTTQIRCYGGGTITISSSKTITAIRFTFSGSYNGGMKTSYTSLSTSSWTITTSSQARITAIEVDYTN